MNEKTPLERALFIGCLILAGEAVFSLPFHVARFFRPTVLHVFDFTNTELGAVQAVNNAKKDLLVVGTDGIDEAVELVKAGGMAATVAQDPYAMGATAVQTLQKLVKGEAVEFDMLVPSKLISE